MIASIITRQRCNHLIKRINFTGSGSKFVVMGDDAMEGELDGEDDDEATVETDDGAGDDEDQAVTETEKVCAT